MKIDKELVDQLIEFNNDDDIKFILNNRFECVFADSVLSYPAFTEWTSEESCPRENIYADVVVMKNGTSIPARWIIAYDRDLDRYSSALYMISINKYNSMQTVLDVQIEQK